MCEEVFVVGGTITDLVDSRYPFIDVVSDLLYRGSESHDMTCARSIFGASGMGDLSSEKN